MPLDHQGAPPQDRDRCLWTKTQLMSCTQELDHDGGKKYSMFKWTPLDSMVWVLQEYGHGWLVLSVPWSLTTKKQSWYSKNRRNHTSIDMKASSTGAISSSGAGAGAS